MRAPDADAAEVEAVGSLGAPSGGGVANCDEEKLDWVGVCAGVFESSGKSWTIL